MYVSEFKPLVIEVFTAVEGFVGTIHFDSEAEGFPGGAISVAKWYGEELI